MRGRISVGRVRRVGGPGWVCAGAFGDLFGRFRSSSMFGI